MVQNLHFRGRREVSRFSTVDGTAVLSGLAGATHLEGAGLLENRVVEASIRFHGHMCAGLALGLRASDLALRTLGADPGSNDLIVAVETDSCSVDGIQAVTGCTFGNGKLYFRDHAKSAYTFWKAGREGALRIVALPDGTTDNIPGFWEAFAKVQRGTATDVELARFFADQQERSQRILAAPDDDLFRVEQLGEPPPARPLVSAPVFCDACGEATMAHRLQKRSDRSLCVACADRHTNLIGSR